MSVTVKHLNADSSFLLLFSPEAQPSSPGSPTSNAIYSILIDPWLQGESVVTAPWFAITRHVVPACIQHLSQIEEPDVVVISQNKPDHCHGETLRQLRPDGKTIIAAEPGAARAIKSWDHFDPARVLPLPKFNPHKNFSYATFYIPPLSRGGHRGVVTLSFMPAKNYMTGLHNAIGITYLAPTHTKSVASVPTVDLQKRTQYFHLSLSSALSAPQSMSQTSAHRPPPLERPLTATAGSYRPPLSEPFTPVSPTPPQSQQTSPYSPPRVFAADCGSPTSTFSTYSQESAPDIASMIDMAFQPNDSEFLAQPLPTPPESPVDSLAAPGCTIHTPRSSTGSQMRGVANPVTAGRPRTLSILYTPHGIPFKPDLMPYVKSHLVPRGALPLTVLLHSFDRATNPWYFGGNIMAGTEGGVEIARGLMARCWLSAHDEAKDDQGLSVKRLKTSKASPEEVRRALWSGPEGEEMRRKGWNCDVRSLAAGQEMAIGQSRSLLSGMENRTES
jgi:Beta-lactamase superfamily domain